MSKYPSLTGVTKQTGPRRVQPVFDVKDLFIFGATVRILADFVILCYFLLKEKKGCTSAMMTTIIVQSMPGNLGVPL